MSFGFNLPNSPLLNDACSLWSVLREYRLVDDSPRKKTSEHELRPVQFPQHRLAYSAVKLTDDVKK